MIKTMNNKTFPKLKASVKETFLGIIYGVAGLVMGIVSYTGTVDLIWLMLVLLALQIRHALRVDGLREREDREC